MPPPNRRMEALALLPPPEAKHWTLRKLGGAGTIQNIVDEMGVVKAAACRYMRLLKEEGLAHIGRWNRTKGVPAAVWVAGPGIDAEPLPPLSSAKYSKNHRKRVRKAIEKARSGKVYQDSYKNHVALALADDLIASTKINPQHAFSALFQ